MVNLITSEDDIKPLDNLTGVITIDYIKSADNLADPFTKGLPRDVVAKSSKGMGLKPMTNQDA